MSILVLNKFLLTWGIKNINHIHPQTKTFYFLSVCVKSLLSFDYINTHQKDKTNINHKYHVTPSSPPTMSHHTPPPIIKYTKLAPRPFLIPCFTHECVMIWEEDEFQVVFNSCDGKTTLPKVIPKANIIP